MSYFCELLLRNGRIFNLLLLVLSSLVICQTVTTCLMTTIKLTWYLKSNVPLPIYYWHIFLNIFAFLLHTHRWTSDLVKCLQVRSHIFYILVYLFSGSIYLKLNRLSDNFLHNFIGSINKLKNLTFEFTLFLNKEAKINKVNVQRIE